jgi:hypothetical protein
MEAEKTTVRVSLNLINLLKSDIKFLTIFSISLFHITLPAMFKIRLSCKNKKGRINGNIYDRNLSSKKDTYVVKFPSDLAEGIFITVSRRY